MTEQQAQHKSRTLLYIIIAVIVASVVAILLINMTIAAQNEIENAGVILTKPDQGLIFQH